MRAADIVSAITESFSVKLCKSEYSGNFIRRTDGRTQCYYAACNVMRCHAMTVRSVAPPSAAISNDIDTIRYASPIAGYLYRADVAGCLRDRRPPPVKNANAGNRQRAAAKDGMDGIGRQRPRAHQGAVRRRRVRSTCCPANVTLERR